MTKTRQVLVVEDSPTFQSYVSSLLEDAGFEPVIFSTLAETKVYLEKEPTFLCAVLDFCLPDAPRGEVIDYVLTHDHRVVVLTSNDDPNMRKTLFDKGIVDFILKDSAVSVAFLAPLLNRLVQNTNKKALVVEDSASMRARLVDLLERQYLTVLSAENGLEALEVCDHVDDINLIITDNDMPFMNGIELVQHLRLENSRDKLSIIGLSASSNPELTSHFLKAGANDYLNKPFCQEELYCRIHTLLDIQDASEQLFYLANRDELTGLWNRRYFFNFAAENPSPNKMLAMIDVDHFKKINDSVGHEGGDHVLKELGNLLKLSFSSALPARLGGEEFVVICTGNETVFEQELIAFKTSVEHFQTEFDGNSITFTVSIGVSRGDRSLSLLLKEADDKLYQAKRNGRNALVI
ncbi:GGDEF domain-containing response regulator [Enterovibrio nigricans]|uniref:diguanylate cyclase n=1 Tax=Enterovibrio nigricans DSM 22720 TaxID=1121868 RepID=A0A1T4U389_9GAMM|nr:response regulator [Enterovibrio nigricans]PKF51821.1 diguanylate cyclase response regulator [Enterovibrio nigricans]SKA47144.1 response regulator receiver modulated diguanylate cyclase [Enterovibrio nigricans DSM 22720]